jgi:hypothetical protein
MQRPVRFATTFKLNYFPVRNQRGASGATVQDLSAEEALLCYPIGDLDDDPEDLVTFKATTAVPVHRTGTKSLRGRVIIDFFGLNHREILHRERARMIAALGAALEDQARGAAAAAVLDIIQRLRGPHIPHAGCVRAFLRLWDEDRSTARRAYNLCRAYGFGEAGTAPPSL